MFCFVLPELSWAFCKVALCLGSHHFLPIPFSLPFSFTLFSLALFHLCSYWNRFCLCSCHAQIPFLLLRLSPYSPLLLICCFIVVLVNSKDNTHTHTNWIANSTPHLFLSLCSSSFPFSSSTLIKQCQMRHRTNYFLYSINSIYISSCAPAFHLWGFWAWQTAGRAGTYLIEIRKSNGYCRPSTMRWGVRMCLVSLSPYFSPSLYWRQGRNYIQFCFEFLIRIPEWGKWERQGERGEAWERKIVRWWDK